MDAGTYINTVDRPAFTRSISVTRFPHVVRDENTTPASTHATTNTRCSRSPDQPPLTFLPTPKRLCEPKYAAAVGVFYTGEAAGETDPDKWPPTAHVLVAGGIVPTGGGDDGGGQLQYTATDTVDILREDGIDEVTGEV